MYYGNETDLLYIPTKFCGVNCQYIEENAFKDCKARGIILPNTVTGIGSYAFHGCSSLNRIFIPATVTRAGTSILPPNANLRVCCAHIKVPSGWDRNWNLYRTPIIWHADATDFFQ